ncbi:fatty acyl-CoA reductase 2-like [Pan troglodytes]|uniref:fatty acyl-CoA reductase 2-like n=1 Tax=Pan troglodytes TaxID=9598 RepID=UPI0030141442
MAVRDLIPIPGDTAVNLPLAVGWCAAVHRPKSMLVYYCTSGNLNPCNRGKMGFQVLATFEIPIPFVRALRRPYADFTTSNFTTQYWNAISQQAPAIICDFYLWLTGRKPRWLDDAVIDEITPKLISDPPNSCTYSKALGEMVVQQESRNLTIAIIRPSTVGATWHDPFPVSPLTWILCFASKLKFF